MMFRKILASRTRLILNYRDGNLRKEDFIRELETLSSKKYKKTNESLPILDCGSLTKNRDQSVNFQHSAENQSNMIRMSTVIYKRYSTGPCHTESVQILSPKDAESLSEAENVILDSIGSSNEANIKKLYSKLENKELASSWLNLNLVSKSFLVNLGTSFLNSRLINYKALQVPTAAILKQTIYSHFCAGENLDEAAKTIERMWALGLKGILDFSVEDATDEGKCDKNLEGFIKAVQLASQLPAGSVSFACVKITALCPLSTLEHASALLRWKNKNPSHNLPWMLPSLPNLSDESPVYSTYPPEPLSEEEERQISNTFSRISKICSVCEEYGLPLLIDAEYTSVQPIIDHLAYAAALLFNKGGFPLVYFTVQCYLRDSMSRLQISLNASKNQNLPFGVKLVRGAYLSRESKMAKKLGVSNPIFETIEETHQNYDRCSSFVLESVSSGAIPIGVVLATHNLNSGKFAASKAMDLGIEKKSPYFHFAQLKGMADDLSLGLAMGGFNVSKYLPYGPVMDVIPYLIRRAEENKALLKNSGSEREKIRIELLRRLSEKLKLA